MRPITEREQRSVIKRRKAMFSADIGSEIEMGVGWEDGGRWPLTVAAAQEKGHGYYWQSQRVREEASTSDTEEEGE